MNTKTALAQMYSAVEVCTSEALGGSGRPPYLKATRIMNVAKSEATATAVRKSFSWSWRGRKPARRITTKL
ncbi:MAG: hypothetical protein WB762_08685 [Candidatus Sulfotelmatobacter sp.]